MPEPEAEPEADADAGAGCRSRRRMPEKDAEGGEEVVCSLSGYTWLHLVTL